MAYLEQKPQETHETRIDISKLNELEYWTFKWKISNFQLFDAIKKTGSTISRTIEDYLKKKRLL